MKIITIIMLALLMACNNPENTIKENNNNVPVNADTSINNNITGCYIQVLQRDSTFAKLKQEGNQVSGTLMFDNYEKDGSAGTLTGTRDGNILKLRYDFQSEGLSSVMDLFFKIEGDQLVRGIGDMTTKGDTAYFTNPSLISYPPGTTLNKISCDSLKN
ncbi:MAG: hypothetical protein ABIP79_09505 [Chitinophagaceae bacterium]